MAPVKSGFENPGEVLTLATVTVVWVAVTTKCRTGRHALSRHLKLACVEHGPDEGSSDVRVAVGVFQGIPVKD